MGCLPVQAIETLTEKEAKDALLVAFRLYNALMDHDECMTTQSNVNKLTAEYNGKRRDDFEKKAAELEVKIDQANTKAADASQRISELEQDAKETAKRASKLALELNSLLVHHGEPAAPIACDPLDAFEQCLRSLKKLKKTQVKQSPTKPEKSDAEEKLREEIRHVREQLDKAKDDIACMQKDRESDKETIGKLNDQLSKLRGDASDGKKGKKKAK